MVSVDGLYPAIEMAGISPDLILKYIAKQVEYHTDHPAPIEYERGEVMKVLKIIVEKHPDGYVAYPLGLKGVVIAEGDTYEEALAEVKSAIQFHVESFGNDAFENDDIMETFVAEVAV